MGSPPSRLAYTSQGNERHEMNCSHEMYCLKEIICTIVGDY